MNKITTKVVVATLSSTLLVGALGPSFADAHAAKSQTPSVTVNASAATTTQSTVPTVTAQQIENIEVEPQGIKLQAIKAALKYGGQALGTLIKKIPYNWATKAGTSIEKYGYKAADVLDNITSFGEASVTATLVAAGIPPNDAAMIAKFIVFFLG